MKDKYNIHSYGIETLFRFLFSSKEITDKNLKEITILFEQYYNEHPTHLVSLNFFKDNCLSSLPDNLEISSLLYSYKEKIELLDYELKKGTSKNMLYKIINVFSPNNFFKLSNHYEICKFLISFKDFSNICKENIKTVEYRNLSIILSTLIKHNDLDSLKIAVKAGLDINVNILFYIYLVQFK